MGDAKGEGRPDERPQHLVEVSGFYMDTTPVTNREFRQFVDATGYVTTAERPPPLEEILAQLPPGTPPPPKEILVPASLVFRPPSKPVPLASAVAWWDWVPGTNWRAPYGPGSSIEGKEDHPVVQVSWEDAVAYAEWAGKELPTEAEWEFAARGGREAQSYAWGDVEPNDDKPCCNIWIGEFPHKSEKTDFATTPVKTYSPNGYGLYDMTGNVWQWCADWYRPDTYRGKVALNPKGPESSFDPSEPNVPKRVQRGGSFLCHRSYCTGYRVSARMKTSPTTSLCHSGFRCVAHKEKVK